jgi:hypothetical protein
MPKCLSTGLVFASPRVPTLSQSNPPPPSLRLPALGNVQRVVALLDSPPPHFYFWSPLCLASRHHPLCCHFVFKNSSSPCQNQGCFHTPSRNVQNCLFHVSVSREEKCIELNDEIKIFLTNVKHKCSSKQNIHFSFNWIVAHVKRPRSKCEGLT